MTIGRVGCILLLWPFAELFVLLWAASTWGWQPVIIAVLVSCVIGLIIIRIGVQATGRSWSQALRTLHDRRIVVDPDTGNVLAIDPGSESATGPTPSMAPPAQTMLLIPAGVAIAIPGFLSDAVGAVLLVPFVRRRIAARWAAGLGQGRDGLR